MEIPVQMSTSAGKTSVSEILMFQTVPEHQKKVPAILPFISFAREKMYSLQVMSRKTEQIEFHRTELVFL